MKKIFRKCLILIMVLAILSPFIELPVNAAGDSCERYLQNYLFLDTTGGANWDHYTKNKGYRTYTSFPYTFPDVADNQYITIESVGLIPLDTVSKLQSFYATMHALEESAEGYTSDKSLGRYGYASELKYNSSSTPYKSETSILHGYWARHDDEELSDAGWKPSNSDVDDDKEFADMTINKVIIVLSFFSSK